MSDIRLMQYMGWSYGDLMECPYDYIEVICDLSREDAQRNRNR